MTTTADLSRKATLRRRWLTVAYVGVGVFVVAVLIGMVAIWVPDGETELIGNLAATAIVLGGLGFFVALIGAVASEA